LGSPQGWTEWRSRGRLRRIADRPRGALDLAALSNLPIEAIASIYNAALN